MQVSSSRAEFCAFVAERNRFPVDGLDNIPCMEYIIR